MNSIHVYISNITYHSVVLLKKKKPGMEPGVLSYTYRDIYLYTYTVLIYYLCLAVEGACQGIQAVFYFTFSKHLNRKGMA